MNTDILWPANDMSGLLALINEGAISSREVMEAHLGRIAGFDDDIRAFVALQADEAITSAKAIDEGRNGQRPSPVLAGLPLGVKDIFHVKGFATSAGTRVLSGSPQLEDATSVCRLQHAGAVILGKTNLDELAFGGSSRNPLFGQTMNPWDGVSVAGGSSGGSAAAVAAGMCVGAIGSDTGGSIRNPAAWCGVVGFKPSFNAISTNGMVAQAPSLDTIGFLAHTVDDCGLLFGYTADQFKGWPDASIPVASQLETRPKIGVIRDLFDGCDPELTGPYGDAINQLAVSADLVEIELPLFESALRTTITIILSEAAAIWEPTLATSWELFGEDIRGALDAGRLIRAVDYLKAQRERQRLTEETEAALLGIDGLVAPTMGLAAAPDALLPTNDSVIDSPMWRFEAMYTCLWNLTGSPAIALPCGFAESGWPISMQIIGHPGRDIELLQLARFAEATWSIEPRLLVPTWIKTQLNSMPA